jgi:hypothetical protein
MIRQAHTYLAGAVSGTALIAAAVVSFVLLVSFQALRDWPLAGISLGGDDNAASAPSSTGGTPAKAGEATGGPTGGAAGAAVGRRTDGPAGRGAAGAQGTRVATGAAPNPASGSPVAKSPASSPGSPGAANGSPPSGSTSASSSGGNGGAGGGPGPTGPANGGPLGNVTQSPSGAVTGAVNDTVTGVDEATGGVVGSTGVPKVTEEAVNNVAGPESPVGKTVDEVGKTVGGLLGN